MNKPIPTIIHKPGKRSTVYYDDYKRLEKYCEHLEKENKDLMNMRFGPVSETPDPRAFFEITTSLKS